MLVPKSEIDNLRRIISLKKDGRLDFHLQQNFHLFFACGFDEARINSELPVGPNFENMFPPEKIEKDLSVNVLNLSADDDLSCFNYVRHRMHHMLFRHESTGEWYRHLCTEGSVLQKGYSRFTFTFCTAFGSKPSFLKIDLQKIIKGCEHFNGISRATSLLLPNLFKKPIIGNIPLCSNVSLLLRALQNENIDLASISWRHLEEVVAELLRSQGLHIELTKQTRDGGRDIIARGELIPGEPTVLAVEVKKKPVVGIADLRQTLHANREFPAVLLATSGRFSAGVITEARTPDTRYRLLLKDGLALKQWIDLYYQKYA